MLLVSPTNRTIGLDFSEYDIWWLNIEYYRRVLDCIR